VCLLSFNSQSIEIRLLPNNLYFTGVALYVPLFVVILIFTGLGLLLGTVLEYFRTFKDRKAAKKYLNQAERLNIEIKHLRSNAKSETDEILSLLK
jgi:uncharacterized integral membrane protein